MNAKEFLDLLVEAGVASTQPLKDALGEKMIAGLLAKGDVEQVLDLLVQTNALSPMDAVTIFDEWKGGKPASNKAATPPPPVKPAAAAAPAALPAGPKLAPRAAAPAKKSSPKGFTLDSLYDKLDAMIPTKAPDFVDGRFLFWAIIGFVGVILAMAMVFAVVMAWNAPPSAMETVSTQVAPYSTPVPTQAFTPTEAAPTGTPAKNTEGYWDALLAQTPPEISPMVRGRFGTPNVIAGLVILILVPVLTLSDANGRKDNIKLDHGFAPVIAWISLAVGVLSVPVSNWLSGSPIGALTALVVIGALWVGLAFAGFAYRDWTHLAAGLILASSMGLIIGQFTLPEAIGRMVGMTWMPWKGVTTVGGLIVYLMSMRFDAMSMTLYVYVTGLLALLLALLEIGKRQGLTATIFLSVCTLVGWGLLAFLFGLGFDYLAARQPLDGYTLAVFEVLKSWLAWLVASLGMGLLGAFLTDKAKAKFGQTSVALNLRGELGLPTVTDFLFAATVVGVVFTLIIR